jgi:hypothetical protein
MYPKLPNVELSGGRSGEDVAWLRPPRSRRRTVVGWVVGCFAVSGRKLAPPAASVTLSPQKEATLAFKKEEKDDSCPQPEARTRSSSPRNFFHHTTTLLMGLSIRKTTELMPKSPVLLLRDVIRRTVKVRDQLLSMTPKDQRCFAGDFIEKDIMSGVSNNKSHPWQNGVALLLKTA